ncbi:MAG: CpsB/CapC family capsule biosynthesis tyrosine phosphatase [Flavobacteriaceae bacterium]|nr:CpsB/CapC family capsule biosynthesis tyrosine phosphatase [Flavobacteriaceae bacterium]
MFFNKKLPFTDLFSEGFVDIHSHLLPGIDDGSQNLDQSILLIEKLRATGIQHFITTPHVLGEVYPNTPEIIQKKLQSVKKELYNRGITNVSLRAAAEYMLDGTFHRLLQERNLLTLKDNYLLVELSFFNPSINFRDLLFEIQLAGYQPILAHPERYVFWHHHYKIFEDLKNSGCLFQLNLLSLTKHYGKEVYKTSEYLIKNGLIDFLGTDTHHLHHIHLLQQEGDAKIIELLKPIAKRNSLFLEEPN